MIANAAKSSKSDSQKPCKNFQPRWNLRFPENTHLSESIQRLGRARPPGTGLFMKIERAAGITIFSKGRSRQLAWHLTPDAPMDQCSVRTTSGTRVLEVESNKIQSKVNQSIFVWKQQGLTTKTSPVAYHLRVAPWHSWAAGLLVAHEGSWASCPRIWYASDWIQKVKLHGTAPFKDDTSRLQL